VEKRFHAFQVIVTGTRDDALRVQETLEGSGVECVVEYPVRSAITMRSRP
jgi:hypothetical protein